MTDEMFSENLDSLKDSLKDSLQKKGVADRSFNRVETSFPIQFLPVSKEEVASLRQTYLSQPTRERMEAGGGPGAANHVTPGTMSAEIISRLDRIEQKLDRLLHAQGDEAPAPRRESSYETGHCIDLSGSGLLFTTRWAMGRGWYIKLRIEPPGSSPLTVITLGRVARVRQDAETSLYETACHFEAIHEEDREELIGYIFKRHRELAQQRRERE